jgi:molecular chaperone GrpE (heat shock protein)
MTERTRPTLVKWPFFLADAILLVLAGWIALRAGPPLGPWALAIVAACVIAAAWFGILPFLKEYEARRKWAEADALAEVTGVTEDLQRASEQIQLATAQWQTVQEHSTQSVNAARDIAERMTAEAQAFGDFMQKTNDAEKGHLRLELEKLRRQESDWLQVLVRVLDHVYALYRAGERSGQPALQEQLGRFQFACYDAARRIGLVPTEAVAGEMFDAQKHQLPDSDSAPPGEGAVVTEMLACGYTYQGQVLRPPVVATQSPGGPTEPAPAPPDPAPGNIAGGQTESFRLQVEG